MHAVKAAEAKPAAVIIDIDGAAASCRHRQHFLAGETPNWEAFFAGAALDESLPQSIALANEHARDSPVIWLTGRPERYPPTHHRVAYGPGLAHCQLHLP